MGPRLLTFSSQAENVNSPNSVPYISFNTTFENLIVKQDNTPEMKNL